MEPDPNDFRLLAGAKTSEDRNALNVAFWTLAQMSPETLGGRLAILLEAHATVVQEAAKQQANPEIMTALTNLATSMTSLEKRLRTPAVLNDLTETDGRRALRIGLTFGWLPLLVGVAVWFLTSRHYERRAQAAAQTPAAVLDQSLFNMHDQLRVSLSPDQRLFTLYVIPQKDADAWQVFGNNSIVLAEPPAANQSANR